jgi:hypothetical protein
VSEQLRSAARTSSSKRRTHVREKRTLRLGTWHHVDRFMRTRHDGMVTKGLRSAAYRNQVDSFLAVAGS